MKITVIPVPGFGAEDVLVTPDGPDEGTVWTGTEDGAILRIAADGQSVKQVAATGGRPLGIEFLPDRTLLVCDAQRGLLKVDPETGAVDVLLDRIDGVPMQFCNNAAVARNGDIWFSDSSTRFSIQDWKSDFVQNTRTGRLINLPVGGNPEVVLDGLAFANGVALSEDESFVAVAETGARTVVRHWIDGPRAGSRDLLADGLPGYPDNISRGSDGLIWVTIASPVDPLVARLHRAPLPLRRVVTRIPERLQPAPKRTVRVQAFDDNGSLVHDVDVDTPDFHMATGVREHAGRVWLGSLHEPAVAVVDLGR